MRWRGGDGGIDSASVYLELFGTLILCQTDVHYVFSINAGIYVFLDRVALWGWIFCNYSFNRSFEIMVEDPKINRKLQQLDETDLAGLGESWPLVIAISHI